MTDIYELWDHRCPELEKLLEEKKIRFQGFACWCSPIERTYQVFEDGAWKNIYECPFCGESMTASMDVFYTVFPGFFQKSGLK